MKDIRALAGLVVPGESDSPRLRAVIVEDEPVARDGLRAMLALEPHVEVIGEAPDGEAAIEAIRRLEPDLLFLDINLPGLDGFGVIGALGRQRTAIVFVTAFEQYALPAFEANAVDYLLKPFNRQRLARAVQRATAFLGVEQRAAPRDTHGAIRRTSAWREEKRRFVVKYRGRLVFIEHDRIDWIESWGNYVRLFVDGRAHLLRATVGSVAERLDETRFLRISRSVIVNVNRIRALEPKSNGQIDVTLAGGAMLRGSRRYRRQLRAFFDRA